MKPQSEMQANSSTITVKVKEVKKTGFKADITYKAELVPAEDAIVSSNAAGQVKEVLFENGVPRLIRRRQTVEEFIALEL